MPEPWPAPALSRAYAPVTPVVRVRPEDRRTPTGRSLFGSRVDAVVVNRVLPAEVSDPWFDQGRTHQAAHLADIEDSFSPLPILRVPLAPAEVCGLEAGSRPEKGRQQRRQS